MAEGGIAMSGSFYQQEFRIPQGSAVSGPDIYVVVFNNSNNQLSIRMTSRSPAGVDLILSETEFTLPASGQKQVLVGVEVGNDAVPGNYEISISAESYKEGGTGIQLAGAASQKANLTVLGESGMVSIQATSPDQQPVVATVRLYRIVSGQEQEVAYSESGSLQAKVAPGSFAAASFMGGIKLAEERFDIAAGGNKNITLSGATVYFEGFDIVPNYEKESGKLAFVQVVYTVKNVYQRVEKGEVILQVSRDGSSPAELTLATLSPLETGRVELTYNYIPPGGWDNGSYDFKLQLKLDGKLYATSLEKHFAANSEEGGSQGILGLSPYVLGGIVAGVVVLIILVVFLVRMLRRY